MKKTVSILGICVLFLLIIFGGAVKPVKAISTSATVTTAAPTQTPSFTSTPGTLIIDPKWEVNGELDSQDQVLMVDVPQGNSDWLQLMGPGITVTESSEICYPFRNYDYGWTGSIYKYINGNWVKLDTKITWPAGSEGSPVACAKAPAAGEYALFGDYSN